MPEVMVSGNRDQKSAAVVQYIVLAIGNEGRKTDAKGHKWANMLVRMRC
jgi:hypothetical protein